MLTIITYRISSQIPMNLVGINSKYKSTSLNQLSPIFFQENLARY